MKRGRLKSNIFQIKSVHLSNSGWNNLDLLSVVCCILFKNMYSYLNSSLKLSDSVRGLSC